MTSTSPKKVFDLAEIRQLYAEETATDGFQVAFTEMQDISQLSPFDEPTAAEMPDPLSAQLVAEMMVRAAFELFADTRLASYSESLAYGVVNSFHRLAEQIEQKADAAARKVKDLAADPDGSEIQSLELEEAITFARSLDEAQDAIACMRDHAAATFAAETGRPWHTGRGSRVSSKTTAAVVDARDYERARREKKREMHAPTGPIVIFSGGADWEDWQALYARLDAAKARIPNMVLATTAQHKGADAIAAAWAAKNGVTVIAYGLNRSLGPRAAFERNKRMLALNPVEAIIAQGSGIQSNLASEVRERGIPHHLIRRPQPQAAEQPERQRAG